MILTTSRLIAVLVFLAVFVMATSEIYDPDFWWHLRTGDYIVTTQSIPHKDVFSFTVAGKPWITEEWLTEVAMILLFRLGNFPALIIFFALVSAAAFTILYLRCDGNPILAALTTLFAALVASAVWGARPQTISLLFASIFLYILERYRRKGADRVLILLILLMVIWPNVHGGFAVGPVLILAYIVGELAEIFLQWNGATEGRLQTTRERLKETKRLAGVFVLSLAAIVVNPNGINLYPYPIQTLASSAIQNFVIEWQPPDFRLPTVDPYSWFLVAILAALALARRRFGLIESMLLLGLTYASLHAVRHISLWVLVAAPMLAASSSEIFAFLKPRLNITFLENIAQKQVPITAAACVLLLAAAALRFNNVVANQPLTERKYFPAAAVNFIQKEELRGPIFNRYDWGGYLLWNLYPRERVFIDGRSDVYGLTEDLVLREYFRIYEGGNEWATALAQFNIRLVLVDEQSPIAQWLSKDSRWTRAYSDQVAVLYARK